MSLFQIDAQLCQQDGICAATCPVGIIHMDETSRLPKPTREAEELCIGCGHCVAVCPKGALSHRLMTSEACPPVQREWILSPERVAHFLRFRRSIRNYRDDVVDRHLIKNLIEIARYAPSGHNVQPVKWLLLYDPEEVQRFAGLVVDWMRHLVQAGDPLAEALHMDRVVRFWEEGLDRICRHAPHMIVVHAPKAERTAPAACTLALSYLELAAPSFGLGACWAGYFNAAAIFWPPMQQALDLPEGDISYGAMMIGYPKYAYHRMPLRTNPTITWR
jgi:nitroreductase/NAD-dependent dihydropyrimidine dehydrogenase PreA subunit